MFVLRQDGGVYRADQRGGGLTAWREYGRWESARGRLTLVNPQSGRSFMADLEQPTLGGHWEEGTRSGGWWCSRRSQTVEGTGLNLSRANSEFFAPPLVSDRMASPLYPRDAIRTAKEGRAVACFLVDSQGRIVSPRIVELSDPIFSEPTLRALAQSTYRVWDEPYERPGCREYRYGLDRVR